MHNFRQTNPFISIAEYALQCWSNDWTYGFSDDFRVYERGRQKTTYLQDLAYREDDYKRIFDRARRKALTAVGLM